MESATRVLGGSIPGTVQPFKPIVADGTGAIAGLTVTSVSAADLVLGSTNEMNIAIAGVNALAVDDAAIVGHAGAAATAGKSIFIETQDGGTAAADTAGPNGATLRVTAGAGAAGGAHTSNNPAGGNSGSLEFVVQAGGAAGSGGSGLAGKAGRVLVSGALAKATTVVAKTTAATLTAAELLSGIITGTHSAGADEDYTLPTGTLMSGAVDMAIGESFEWDFLNLSGTPATNTITITAGTDHTVVGENVVGNAEVGLNSRRCRTLKTGATTWVTYVM